MTWADKFKHTGLILKAAGLILMIVFLIGSCAYSITKGDMERFQKEKDREENPLINDAGQRIVWVRNVSKWIKRHPEAKIIAISNQHVGSSCIVYTVEEKLE